jgi:hypothetical protein
MTASIDAALENARRHARPDGTMVTRDRFPVTAMTVDGCVMWLGPTVLDALEALVASGDTGFEPPDYWRDFAGQVADLRSGGVKIYADTDGKRFVLVSRVQGNFRRAA